MHAKPPRIVIVCPASAEANNGNWRTARRWQTLLRGHAQVRIVQHWPDALAARDDLMFALHARKSAAAAQAWQADAGWPGWSGQSGERTSGTVIDRSGRSAVHHGPASRTRAGVVDAGSRATHSNADDRSRNGLSASSGRVVMNRFTDPAGQSWRSRCTAPARRARWPDGAQRQQRRLAHQRHVDLHPARLVRRGLRVGEEVLRINPRRGHPVQRQEQAARPRILAHIAGDIRQLHRKAKVTGPRQGIRVPHPHQDTHHRPDR